VSGGRIGLALSGGTARSVAHVGVIKALEENGIRISYLAGTSGGSLVAALYAAGKSSAELIELAEDLRWRKLVGLVMPKLGLLSSDKIREFVVQEIGDIEFSDLAIPTAVVAADLTSGEKVVFSDGKVAPAVQASCSIPNVYSPVELNSHYIVDGGIAEHMPVETLSLQGEMFRIGVNLGSGEGLRKKPRHLLEVVVQVSSFVERQTSLASTRLADFIIRPPVEGYSHFDLHKASQMIEEGYRETVRVMPELKAAIERYRSPRSFLQRMLGRAAGRRRGGPV
jgi:NTE family protein